MRDLSCRINFSHTLDDLLSCARLAQVSLRFNIVAKMKLIRKEKVDISGKKNMD